MREWRAEVWYQCENWILGIRSWIFVVLSFVQICLGNLGIRWNCETSPGF